MISGLKKSLRYLKANENYLSFSNDRSTPSRGIIYFREEALEILPSLVLSEIGTIEIPVKVRKKSYIYKEVQVKRS